MAALIGALRATLSADTAQFESGMRRARREAANTDTAIHRSLTGATAALKSFGAGFLGALSVGALTTATKAALDYAGGLGEAASAAGVTTRELQLFRFAAEQNAVSTENADKSLSKLTLSMSQALNGSKQARAAFASFGVSLEDIQKKSKTEVIAQIAERIKETGGAAANASNGVKLFGKNFMQLAPLLDQGRDGMNALAAAADELGIVLTEKQIADADVTADKLDALMTVLKANIASVVADNAQSILGLANSLASLTRSVVGFLNSNPMTAMSILGAMAGGAVGGLPGAAIGGFAGLVAGAKAASSKTPPADLSLLRHNFIQAVRRKDYKSAKALRDKYVAAGGTIPGYNPQAGLSAMNIPAVDIGDGGKKTTGSGRKPRDTSQRDAVDGLRDSYDFAREQSRNEVDILQAQRDLTRDYVERATISQQILDANRKQEEAELAYQVALFDVTKGQQGMSQAQADALNAQRKIVHGLETQAIQQDEQLRRAEEYERTEQLTADIQLDLMKSRSSLAETASERRAVELDILRLTYEEKRRRLESLLAQSRDADEQNRIRMEIAALSGLQAADRAGIMQSTRGPMEAYWASLPTTAAKWEEALQSVRVRGLQGLEDGLMDVMNGVKSLKDAFKDFTKQVIADLLRIAMQRAIIAPLAKALFGEEGSGKSGGGGFFGALLGLGKAVGGLKGGSASTITTSSGFGKGPNPFALPGFANGGSFRIGGNPGTDKNTLSLNGQPVARVSRGEMVNISTNLPIARTSSASRSAMPRQGDMGAMIRIEPSRYFDAVVDGRAQAVAAPIGARATMAGAAGGMAGVARQRRRAIP